ncbi:hypothetical protein [Staphylococcus felis]|uniref:hypothetical protein n=1 Tax=Staphylococcus felis TaxID=46127 RepID=UPI0039677B96
MKKALISMIIAILVIALVFFTVLAINHETVPFVNSKKDEPQTEEGPSTEENTVETTPTQETTPRSNVPSNNQNQYAPQQGQQSTPIQRSSESQQTNTPSTEESKPVSEPSQSQNTNNQDASPERSTPQTNQSLETPPAQSNGTSDDSNSYR